MNDLRRTVEVIWVVAMLLLASGAFAPLWTDPTLHDQVIEGETSLQMVWAVNYLIVALVLLSHWKEAVALLTANRFLCLLALICLASAAWSANPGVTLRKSSAIVGTTLLGVMITMRFDLKEQIRLVAAALGIAAVASLAASLLCPTLFPVTEVAALSWNGIFSHKNLLGRNMSLGAMAFLLLPRRTMAGFVASCLGSAFCIAMLIASRSQTALVVLLAVVIFAAFSRVLRWEWRQASGTALLLVATAAPLAWLAFVHAETLTTFLHRDITLTGRSKIWEYATTSFFKRPLLGYGYGAFWWVADESRQALALIGYKTPHAHNGFLDLGLQLGVFGVVLFAAGWLAAVWAALRFQRIHRAGEARWPLLYLLFIILYSFTENSLLTPNSLFWILYVAAGTTVIRQPLRGTWAAISGGSTSRIPTLTSVPSR
jgi:exopolysaccharide production protein ExoQ